MMDWADMVVATGVERYNNRSDDERVSIGACIGDVMREHCMPISRVEDALRAERGMGYDEDPHVIRILEKLKNA